MRFSTYLNENKSLHNEATLVIHKIIHMIDSGHVDQNDSDIRFTIGPMIHKGSYNTVSVVIRKSERQSVRLAKARDGNNAVIVIDTKKLPERKNIDTFLSDKAIFDGFVSSFTKYLSTLHNHDADHDEHESETELHNTEDFEENYKKLIEEIEKNVEAYTTTKAEVTGHVENSANIIKHETTKLSIKNLQKEYLGNTEAEFVGIIKKLPAYENFKGISKELTTKLESRLKTYFISKIKSLTAD
jgi:uncharacterized membrane protein YcgQ (UPF0703/DUF1980 family)